MSLNFIKAWRNDRWYNNRVLIWCFTLVLIKINYGQIGDQTGLFYTTNPVFYTRQSVRWKPMFFRTELIFTGFVRPTGMFGNLCCLTTNYVSSRHCFRPVRTSQKYILQLLQGSRWRAKKSPCGCSLRFVLVPKEKWKSPCNFTKSLC
jgi:hypothetical protein